MGNSLETAVCFDSNGNEIFRHTGTESSVVFTAEEVGLLEGNILTHNHPGKTSFSTTDIDLLIKKDIAEIRVATTSEVFTFSLTDAPEDALEQVMDEVKWVGNELFAKKSALIKSGDMTIDYANFTQNDEIWRAVNKQFDWVNYERKPW